MTRLSPCVRRALAGGLAALGLAGGTLAQWDPNYGSVLSNGDDVLIQGVALPFAFPVPGGGTTNAISISTNGWVKLAASTTSSSSELLESTSLLMSEEPRIATVWDDLTGVASANFTPDGLFFDGQPSRALVTWRMREYGTDNPVDVQLTLLPNGAFTILVGRGANDCITGVSVGNGATAPAPSDLSAGVVGGGPTIFEQFTTSSPSDLNGNTLIFLPNVAGYDVAVQPTGVPFASKRIYGQGCPSTFYQGGMRYELFDGSNGFDLTAGGPFGIMWQNAGNAYAMVPCPGSCWEPNFQNAVSWATGTGDDSLSGPLSLGFTASFAGVSTSQIEVCSNGFVWLVAGSSTSSDFTESAAELATQPARLAVLWDDFNNASSGGGTVYFDTFPASGSQPARAVITWHQVPEYTNTGSNTFQMQLWSTGDVVYSYQQISATDGLVGMSVGGLGGPDGAIDYSTGLPAVFPFQFTNHQPMELDTSSGLPTLGSTVTYEASALSGALAAVLHVGTTPLALPLDGFGMTGCHLYTNPDLATGPMTISSGTATLSLPVPNAPVLIGVRLQHQALGFAPGVNALNISASNGLELTLGR